MAESDEAVIALLLLIKAELRAMCETVANSPASEAKPANFDNNRAELRATVAAIRGSIAASGQRLCAEMESLRLLVEQNRSELEASVRPDAWRMRRQ